MKKFLVIYACFILATQMFSFTAEADEDPIITIDKYPSPITGGKDTIIPVTVTVEGNTGTDYEVASWIYGDGAMRSDNWNPDDENWNWVNYFSIQLGPDGTWTGDIYLKLKQVPPEGSYLKAKVRESDDSDTYHEQKIENLEISDNWGFVQGYATNGEEPYAGEIVEVLSGDNLIASNFTENAPWASDGDPGWFKMPVPAGEYILKMREYEEQASIVITNGETTSQNLGDSEFEELISITEYSRSINEGRTLIYTEVIIVAESPMLEYDIRYSVWDGDTDIASMWDGEDWVATNKKKTVTTDEDGKAEMKTLLNLFYPGSSSEYNLTTELFNSDGESVTIANRTIKRNVDVGWVNGILGEGNETKEIFVYSDGDLEAFSFVEPFPWEDNDHNTFNLSLLPGEYILKIPGVVERTIIIEPNTETILDLTAKILKPEVRLNYPDETYNAIGTIIPFDAGFRGLPAINYEVKAWFYGDGSIQSSFWTGEDWSSNFGPYLPIEMNETFEWNGELMVKLDKELTNDSYFKLRFRNSNDKQDYYDMKIYPNITVEWTVIEGYIGKDMEPIGGEWIEVFTEGQLFTFSISLPNKWSTDNRWGYYNFAAPNGNYQLHWMGETTNLVVNGEEKITLNLGYEPKPSIDTEILIEWVYYDPWLKGENDESVCLINQGEDVDIGGWGVSDLEKGYTIPWDTIFPANSRLIIALNSTSFYESHNFWPDFKMIEDGSDVPLVNGEAFYLTNSGDSVIVRDHNGLIIDSVAYGNSEIPDGWEGGPAATVTEGKYLHRNNENHVEYLDTNTSIDWKSFRDYRPGQTNYIGEEMVADSIIAFTSPDSTFWTIQAQIQSATDSIDLSLYYLNHPYLVDELVTAIERGVNVRVLLEGAPVAGFTDAYTYRAQTLKEAGADVRLMMKTQDAPTRYPYLHAKYAIIDNEKVIIMSENWGLTGIPINDDGNRGWGVVVESSQFSSDLTMIFENDFTLDYGDVVIFDDSAEYSDDKTETGNCCHNIEALKINEPTNVRLVVTPDNSLSDSAIIGLLRNAEKEIIIQQHQFTTTWDDTDSPYWTELLDAIDRGVKVSVMFDGTEQYMAEQNQYAYLLLDEKRKNGADIDLLIYRSPKDEFIRIHNKGIIVDEKYTLVSSINWGAGGGSLNREIGVIIESQEIATFYKDIFWGDWEGREDLVEEAPTNDEKEEDGKLPYLGLPSIIATILIVSYSRLFNRNRLS